MSSTPLVDVKNLSVEFGEGDSAARALGLSDWRIMYKHLLPNAMVATLTFLPFKLSGGIAALTALDFLGLGMPPGSASLGELLLQGKSILKRRGSAYRASSPCRLF